MANSSNHAEDDHQTPLEIWEGSSGGRKHFKRRAATGPSTILNFLDGKAIDEADATALVGKCGICKERTSMMDGEELKKLENCSHAYHRGCMAVWVKWESPLCPLCRKKLSPRDLRPIQDTDWMSRLLRAFGIHV